MNQRLTILGAGESGVGAALLAQAHGWAVFVSDRSPVKPRYAAELNAAGIRWEQGTHTMEAVLAADLVIKSPGIPQKVPVVEAIRAAGIPIVSEIEFASRYTRGQIIAITGTNGKTTTTRMTYEILHKGGLDVGMGGNISPSFARALHQADHDWWVLEISSFQLEDIQDFRPHIAVITNLSRNHLDRYDGQMAGYANAKLNIARNQTEDDYLLYCLDSPDLVAALQNTNLRTNKLGYSPTPREDAAIFFSDHSFHFNLMTRKKQKSYRLPMEDVSVAQSGPNSYNALAASSIGSLLEIRKESIRQSLMEFQNSPHRMEEVTTLNGRTFINDSKATNLNATWFALEGMNKPVVWIVGGVDKGNDYGTVLDLVKSKVKTIVMLGKNVDKIRNAFDGQVDRLYHATSMEEAVHKAYQFGAEAGEESVVLLSPACASFDMYEDYEARGDHFKRVIRTLK